MGVVSDRLAFATVGSVVSRPLSSYMIRNDSVLPMLSLCLFADFPMHRLNILGHVELERSSTCRDQHLHDDGTTVAISQADRIMIP